MTIHPTSRRPLLVDLDGTLVNTVDRSFKLMKDGEVPVDIQKIQVFPGAYDFLAHALAKGYTPYVVSDSHPRYVDAVVRSFFAANVSGVLSLADKPNTIRTVDFLHTNQVACNVPDAICIGDTWLDIELGRGLQIPTMLTTMYAARQQDVRDGIGRLQRHLKSGPTFRAASFEDAIAALDDPRASLLCLEAAFQGKPTANAVTLFYYADERAVTIHRALSRQGAGECDAYALQDIYAAFNRVDRTPKLLDTISEGLIVYLNTLGATDHLPWNVVTYLPSKPTTTPARKLEAIVDRVFPNIDLLGEGLFVWDEAVTASVRQLKTFDERVRFVLKHLHLAPGRDVQGKHIVVIDDQYTTGATAAATANLLRQHGARNILYLSLFYLIDIVASAKTCPICKRRLQIKINGHNGNKFYSCVPPKFRGEGCGYTEDI